MIRHFRTYGVLCLSLIALFAAGVLVGRLTSPQTTVAKKNTADPAAGPESWVEAAGRGLVRDLELDSLQSQQIQKLLEPVAHELYADRERTLFQMHLRLILLHDTLAKEVSLTGSQVERLTASRIKLKNLIIQKFPSSVRNNPVLAVESESIK